MQLLHRLESATWQIGTRQNGKAYLLERGEGSQDGASDPDRVLPLGWRDDLDLHGGRRQCGDLLLHAIGDSGVHGGAAGKHRVGVQILTDVDVALHDAVVGRLVDAAGFHSEEGRLEQSFRTPDSNDKLNRVHLLMNT